MTRLPGSVRYAFRQFRLSPVFTAAVVLTLALGIGGTTAIFTLINAIMLRSLPVSDPARLYRIGDGDDCCVEGGPQDRWGMFSFPLYERLKAASPEFEEVTAFQAGGARVSVRRQGVDTAARPLRSEYVTGSYFSTLGDPRVRRPGVHGRRRQAGVRHPLRCSAITHGRASTGPTLGRRIHVRHRGPSVHRDRRHAAGVLRRDSPAPTRRTCGSRCSRSRSSPATAHCCTSPSRAWLRVIGRLKPGASTDGMAPRLTGVLRSWMQHDSGYPANWMPDIVRMLPKQVLAVVPAGAGVGVMKEEYGRSLQILLAVCGLVLLIACANVANLLLARAAARRGQTAVRLAIGATQPPRSSAQALVESTLLAIAGGLVGLVVAVGAARLLLALAFHESRFLPISVRPSLAMLSFAFGVALVTGVAFGAVPAWFATRTDPIDALRRAGPRRERPFVARPHGSARRAGHAVRRAGGRRDDAREEPRQARAPGLRLPRAGAGARVVEQPAGHLRRCRS